MKHLSLSIAMLMAAMLIVGCGKAKTVTVTTTNTVTDTTTVTGTPEDTETDTNGSDDGSADGEVASIVIGKSIAGVELSMTQSKIQQLMGPPDTSSTESTELGNFTTLEWGKTFKVVLTSASSPKTAFTIETKNPGDKTAEGIGPGSSFAAVKAAYPKASCDSGAGIKICRIASPDSVVTDFIVKGGKVWRVVIGVAD